MMNKQKANNQENTSGNKLLRGESKNALEWVVFGLSLLLLLTVFSYLIYETLTHKPTPADISVEYTFQPTDNLPHRYHILLSNKGGATAENVFIELELMDRGIAIEKAEMELQYVPRKSSREGWVNFSSNPLDADSVVARVVSYKKPS